MVRCIFFQIPQRSQLSEHTRMALMPVISMEHSLELFLVPFVQATITIDNSAMLVYVFFPNFWGKGYALEAVKCMINYLVETYQNLDFRADVDVENHRSIALLHNLGFVRSTFF
ncbi:GNAT family N-acetyltransferase [Nostoc sp. LPT]|uniref:GNAT family N-acetyltransferase n=1 Tax=Nostoc sp. LPT TaxID=2815387 RepID=UPI001D26846F|nr:GNAT family N-acetyltransferase [Nostoc sp. LPT]MBN4002832.1 GNAT family N-acetyltransferase [Nostoc sp. LPT]